MATNDMMRQIEIELAKRKRARQTDVPWWADVASKAIADIPRQQERAAEWKARRSKDAIGIMNMYADDYDKNYNNTDIERKAKRLENYISKNQGKFDDTAMDYAQVTLDGMRDQMSSNIEFQQYQDRLPDEVGKVREYISGLDRTKQFNAENIAELTDMQAPLIKYVGEFQSKFGDRLASKSYEDYGLQLKQTGEMNAFLLQSAKDDKFLRDDELAAYFEAWKTLTTAPIERFRKLEDVKIDGQIKTLKSDMGTQYEYLNALKQFRSGEEALQIDESGNYNPKGTGFLSWADATSGMNPTQLAVYKANQDKTINSLIDKAEKMDTQFQTLTTEGSYLKGIDENIFTRPPKVEGPPPPPKATQDFVSFKKGVEEKKEYEKSFKSASYEYKYKSGDFFRSVALNKGQLLKDMANAGVLDKKTSIRYSTQGIPAGLNWTDEQINYMENYVINRAGKLKDRAPNRAIALYNAFEKFKSSRGGKMKYFDFDADSKKYKKKKYGE